MKGIKCLTDTFKLQNDLNSVYRWTNSNNAKLNGKKFENMSYGKNNDLKKESIYLTDTGCTITTKNNVKDLGVILNSNLKYDDHIDKIISKVNGICSWILRVFSK